MKNKKKKICEESSAFYYDYLQQDLGNIDHNIISHIEKCAFCQNRIKDLKTVLEEKNNIAAVEEEKRNTPTINILASHFNLINKPITCGIAKIFMPNLARMSIDIRTKTPITMHINNCKLCQQDLDTIRNLQLTSGQLNCLARIFSAQTIKNQNDCEKYENILSAPAENLNFDKDGVALLKHVSVCGACRNKFNESQRKLLKNLPKKSNNFVECKYGNLTNTDYFDYCFPYGIGNEKDLSSGIVSKEFFKHITTCPSCLGKTLKMKQKIYAIVDRPESGIVTKYYICDQSSDKNSNLRTKKHFYKGAISFKKVAKTAAAVAALFLVAFWLHFVTAAKAIEYKEIYQVIKTAKNICFITTEAGMEAATQKIWISKDLSVKLFNSGTKWILWDIAGKQVKTYDSNAKTLNIQKFEDTNTIKAGEALSVSKAILPLQDPSVLPNKYGWKIYDGLKTNTAGDIYTCELLWSSNLSDGSKIDYKWLVQVDKKTMLPKRVENWCKQPSANSYKLQSYADIVYPLKSDIEKLLIELDYAQQ